MDERLRLAYATAMHAQHQGGRVEIHFGSAMIAYLKAMCEVVDASITATRCWGFPVVESTIGPDHISVHVVTVIP